MQCPRCQHENPQHAKFCLECGTGFAGPDNSRLPVLSYEDLHHALTEGAADRDGGDPVGEVLMALRSPAGAGRRGPERRALLRGRRR
jgi:hypothetical protein